MKAQSGGTVCVPIVAIGASAGGITALQKLFESLPADLALAFVVIQHLPHGEPSLLPRLLSHWTTMPVLHAVDGLRAAPGRVYVPSPDHILTLETGTFRTRPADGGERRPGIDTIDAFLESLSQQSGSRAIAVILSGTGMDGTAGALVLRQAGGIVIVQDPLTALHDGMPKAIIDRGLHDHVLPVAAIGQQLLACSDASYVRPEASTDWTSDVPAALHRILACVRVHAGFDLTGYKPSPLLWRIQQRMEVRRVRRFEDYGLLIEDDPVERETLVRGLPIHVTDFFRDPDAWTLLSRDVLTPLVRDAGNQPIRAWTPACSTGEEAYSVAMILEDLARKHGVTPDFQLFATDAAPEIVAQASRGYFLKERTAAVSPARLHDHFYAVDRGFRVKRLLRERMVFATQDLLADPPFSDLDLITCRNLLIYLERDTIEDVLHLLHGSLRIGGYLFLGSSEAQHLGGSAFEAVSARWNIYRKIGPMARQRKPRASTTAPSGPAVLAAVAHSTTVDDYDVPSVLIDDECTVLRVYGDTRPFLGLRPGEPSLNLLDLVPLAWRPFLRAMVDQALGACETVNASDLYDGLVSTSHMSLRVTPIDPMEPGRCQRLLVSFLHDPLSAAPATDGDRHPPMPEPALSGRFASLDDWRVSREELEASREELQALNEELNTSNTQLNDSNNDLNEANTELQETIAQLKLQSDVLSSGAVMTLFLDGEKRLRWFTPAMQDAMSLVPGDKGRRISDLVPKFKDASFFADIEAVLAGASQREAVVRGAGQRWYLRRVNPHQLSGQNISGVAVTFADITDRTTAEHALRASETRLLRSEAWLSAQKESFQSAMNGASLEASLAILIQTLVAQAHDGRRCAFYIAKGDILEHVTGMSDAYAECVNGFKISPESLACGLAVATGKPVFTRDVLDEPRWQPWTWLAQRFGYRGCWSFPVATVTGDLVGSLAMYFDEPRSPTELDVELAAAFTQTAAIIIARHSGTEPAIA